MANVPVSVLQGGSVLDVGASGTINVASGGSIQVASGAVINIASGGSLTGNGVNLTAPVVSNITIGGTLGRWAFGTVGVTTGLGTIATGLTRVTSAVAVPILGEAPNIGSAHWVLADLSLSASGSVIFRVGSANGQFGANATISWGAWGT